MNAEIGTPAGSSHSGSSDGHCVADTVKRAFGCAALRPQSGVQSWPCQSMRCAGGVFGHAFPPDVAVVGQRDVGEDAVRFSVSIAFGFDSYDVPGATPK